MRLKNVRIADFAKVTAGGTPSRGVKSFYEGTIPWIKTLDLNVGVVTDTEEKITAEGLRSIRGELNPPGTVMVAMYGGAGTIGKSGLLGISAATNQAVASILPNPSVFDSAFLHFQLRHLRSAWMQFSQGNRKDPNINKSIVENMLVWLPHDVAYQATIGLTLQTQLAAVEQAREAAQAQLTEIRLLKKQALKAVFTAIEDTCPLGDVARIQSGYAFKSETFQKQGVRLLRNANMAPGRVYWDDAVFLAPGAAQAHTAYALAEGDVLISLDRPIISTGIKVARVTASDLPALLVQRVGRFRIDKTRLNADYLYAFLHTEPFIEAISGHEQSLGVPHVSPGQIEEIEIPLPSIEEQQRLAVILNDIADATHKAQVAATQQLRDIELLPSRLLAQVFDTHGDHQNDD